MGSSLFAPYGSIIFDPIASLAIQVDPAQMPSVSRAFEKTTVRNALTVYQLPARIVGKRRAGGADVGLQACVQATVAGFH